MEIDVDDERFMRRAVELAREPAFTSPNPRVGAVLVRDGSIVASGAYEGPGMPHAEAAALAAVSDAAGATCYVTLEPCAHQGLTPPCAGALVDAGIVRVVAAIEDPDHRVSGRGIAYLRDHGVRVDVGVLSGEARAMNAAYLHQRTTGRPLVTVKLALTLDGRLAAPDGSAMWITGEGARAEVHRRRREVDAVMVGAGTVAADDPSLTVREVPTSRQPVAVIVDSSGRTDPNASIFTTGAPVIVATTEDCSHERQTAWKEAGAEVLVVPARAGSVDLGSLLDELSRRGWIEIMCEGGAELATSLLRAELATHLEIYHGAVVVGRGGPDIGDLGIGSLARAPRFELVSHDRFGDDVRTIYRKREA